ncbi:MAG TPA: 5-oxoprolinase subunit PxpA [Chloroflexia bacterium]|nr:5-oxoprolinase subunit PxpA [Chloroflexia bacterium]
MSYTIDLNADMGESFGNYVLGQDEALLDVVTSANIACGFHAGDPTVMAQTVSLAARKGVAIGAHPSYPDLQGFGRRKMDMTPAEIEACLLYQIGALNAFAQAAGTRLTHVKAHGMLYNVAAAEKAVAQAYARAVARYNPDLALVCLATSPMMIEEGERAGLRVVREAFADRAYNPDGSLVSRRLPGSMLEKPEDAARQVLAIAREGRIRAHDGSILELQADTICIHGDGPHALEIAQQVRAYLEENEVKVAAPLRS